jgi:hypothetical protein
MLRDVQSFEGFSRRLRDFSTDKQEFNTFLPQNIAIHIVFL